MGKISGWRADDESCKSDLDKIRDQIRKKSQDEYGRPDIPGYVQRAAESCALRKRVSNKKALDILVKEAGTLEELASQLSKILRKTTKKNNKSARLKADLAQEPKSSPSQFQLTVDASKRSKYVSIVLGGAPGLGKKA
ncbi:hypothetical protein [Zoogloea sp.]|uniref:hypothetical protein n=1 Tax=Zoogloea sp. TaxID=49181 RepID=UPI001AD15F7D|nr:hypothetical protein [Zoogloea sp.]MBN8282878.1 hypothetical protein [Zoogloea sp.]